MIEIADGRKMELHQSYEFELLEDAVSFSTPFMTVKILDIINENLVTIITTDFAITCNPRNIHARRL